MRVRRWLLAGGLGSAGVVALLVATAVLCSGCGALGYYGQSVGGHLSLLNQSRPVADWLADPATPESLKRDLALAQRMRRFAADELKLPDNASYTRYADLHRDAVVWNVVAAPELSLTLKTWCYPVMGCVGYRGYFDAARAEAEGQALRGQGLDVDVYGVPAYSTLGWSNWLGGDPLLNTFVGRGEAALARLVFHELAHQLVYVADDTTFNESYATAVERIGLRRWRAAQGLPPLATPAVDIRGDFQALTLRARDALQQLYAGPLSDAEKRQRKAQILAGLRAEAAGLKAGRWNGYAGYDSWLAKANNASLALQAAYDALVPDFERLFEREGQDFGRFHAAVKALAALPRDQRRATLQAGR